METKKDKVNDDEKFVNVKSTGDDEINHSSIDELKRNFVGDKSKSKETINKMDADKKDVIGCVHYKRRAKFVVSLFIWIDFLSLIQATGTYAILA